jgi:hypothetical protein
MLVAFAPEAGKPSIPKPRKRNPRLRKKATQKTKPER